MIEPRRDLFEALLDRDKRLRGCGAFDLSAGFREKRGHFGGLKVRSGVGGEPLDPVSQFADLALQSLKRRRAQRCGGEEIAHFFRLPADALKCLRLYRRRREAVDLAADRADLAFERRGCRLRVMSLQRSTKFGSHRFKRSEHRFAVTALPQHLHTLREVADRALDRNDRIAWGQLSEALAHCVDLSAHGAEVDGGIPLIGALAPHIVKLAAEGSNVVEQQLRERRRAAGLAGGRRRTDADFGGFQLGRRLRLAWDGAVVSASEDLRGSGGVATALPASRVSISWRRIAICDTAALRSNGGLGSSADGCGERSTPPISAGQACPDRFQPTHGVDQRAAVTVSRGGVTFNNMRDAFEGARRLRLGP